jgi:hypothetical protein
MEGGAAPRPQPADEEGGLGINSDGDAKKVAEILEREEITWRQALDGTTSGPIAKQWNVHGWPMTYVLDDKGVIRFKNARGQKMDEAVEKLLAEMEKPEK